MNYDLIIIGGGPAGMAAAQTTGNMGYRVLLIEKAGAGSVMQSIGSVDNMPGYPPDISGPELAAVLREQVKKAGVTQVVVEVKSVYNAGYKRVVVTEKGTFDCGAVIMATGVTPQRLNLSGEEKYLENGIHYCMFCDYRRAEGKKVGIVGGAESAVKAALFLSRYAAKVYIIHQSGDLRSSRRRQVLEDPKIRILDRTSIKGLYGKGSLAGVEITTGGVWARTRLDLEILFVYIGGKPRLTLFRNHVRSLPS